MRHARNALAAIVGIGLVVTAPGGASSDPGPPVRRAHHGDVLGKHDRALVADAVANRAKKVQLLLVTDAGRSDEMNPVAVTAHDVA